MKTPRDWLNPGHESILLDLEKLFLLSDSLKNQCLHSKKQISNIQTIKHLLFVQTRYFHDSWVGTDTPGHGESEFADENVQILQGNLKNQVFRPRKNSKTYRKQCVKSLLKDLFSNLCLVSKNLIFLISLKDLDIFVCKFGFSMPNSIYNYLEMPGDANLDDDELY